VGKVINPEILNFRHDIIEKDKNTDYISILYWIIKEGKYIKTDCILEIEFDKRTKIIKKIKDYPAP